LTRRGHRSAWLFAGIVFIPRLFSTEEKTAAEIAPFETGDSSRLRKERVLRLDDLHWQAR
jgi:hypothetical protein